MSGARGFRLVLAVIIAFPALRAVPAYSWHGSGNTTALAIDPKDRPPFTRGRPTAVCSRARTGARAGVQPA